MTNAIRNPSGGCFDKLNMTRFCIACRQDKTNYLLPLLSHFVTAPPRRGKPFVEKCMGLDTVSYCRDCS